MTAAAVEIRFPTLYGKQHDAFFHDDRLGFCEATTKAGKSVGGIVWQSTRAINVNPGSSRLWLEPVYPLAKIMFERVIRMYSRMDPNHETGWDTNKTDLVFVHPGGSRQYFRGSDRPDLIYGPDYADAVIDEASRCKEEAWHAVRSTTTATRGPIRCIGNVRGRKNWFYRLARKAEAGEPGMRYSRITANDAVEAGILDREEIESARRDLPDAVFRQLYMAEAADDEGNPFGIEAIGRCIAGLAEGKAVVYGWDLAKSIDWTVGIGINAQGRVCDFHRWQSDWDSTREQIQRISRGVPCVVDSTGVGSPVVEDLQRRGSLDVEGYTFTAKSKQLLMEGLRNAIHTQEISILDGTMRAELEAFEYEYTASGVRYSAPDGMHDDCVCALALALYGKRTMWVRGEPSDFGGRIEQGTNGWHVGIPTHGDIPV